MHNDWLFVYQRFTKLTFENYCFMCNDLTLSACMSNASCVHHISWHLRSIVSWNFRRYYIDYGAKDGRSAERFGAAAHEFVVITGNSSCIQRIYWNIACVSDVNDVEQAIRGNDDVPKWYTHPSSMNCRFRKNVEQLSSPDNSWIWIGHCVRRRCCVGMM